MTIFDNAVHIKNEPIGLLRKKIEGMFTLVGSRRILHESMVMNSDWDYAGVDDDISLDFLLSEGFERKIVSKDYMDSATTSVWTHPMLKDLQVTLKSVDKWDSIIDMWKHFDQKPHQFRDNFWKSNPNGLIDQDMVRARIDMILGMYE